MAHTSHWQGNPIGSICKTRGFWPLLTTSLLMFCPGSYLFCFLPPNPLLTYQPSTQTKSQVGPRQPLCRALGWPFITPEMGHGLDGIWPHRPRPRTLSLLSPPSPPDCPPPQQTFIFLGSRITVEGDCGHEIKRWLLLGRKAVINLDSTLKKQTYHFANEGLYS